MDDIYERLRKRSAESELPTKPVPKPQAMQQPDAPRVSSSDRIDLPSHGTRVSSRPSRSKKRWIIIAIIVISVGAATAALVSYMQNRSLRSRFDASGPKAPPEPLRTETEETAPTSVRLVATGDMIAHEAINKNAQKPEGGYDYAALMADVKQFFDKSDINFCNQSTPAGGEAFGITGYPSFNAPVEFARGLENAGCNLINIGTNHTNDKGQPLVDATVAAWDERSEVLAVGGANRSVEEQQKQRIFTVNEMKFGFVSYSTYTNKPVTNGFGVNMYDEAKAKAEITALRPNVDFVIVSMRWGTEYSPDVNAQQDQIAQVLADAGADVVLGHGPHDLEPVKRLKAADGRETLVWFSLGNFLNSQLDIQNLIGGFAIMDIDITTKKITKVAFMPVYQHYEWTADQARRRNNTDLAARHSFRMVPLDQAAELLGKSHHGTTVEAQTSRIQQLLNRFTEIPIIKSTEF
jgi:poly-gamma-glutamate capsule biosynthesis protein CapA/YwtB (metallophosphatase superfamily)